MSSDVTVGIGHNQPPDPWRQEALRNYPADVILAAEKELADPDGATVLATVKRIYREQREFVAALEAKLPKKTVPDYDIAWKLGLPHHVALMTAEERTAFLEKLTEATRVPRPREKMANALTGAERAKRARLKKNGERVPRPPRGDQSDDLMMLHIMNEYPKAPEHRRSIRTLQRRHRSALELVAMPDLLTRISWIWKHCEGHEPTIRRQIEMQLTEALTKPELFAFEQRLPELQASDVAESDALVREMITEACNVHREVMRPQARLTKGVGDE